MHRIAPWALVSVTVVAGAGAIVLDALSSRNAGPEWGSYVFPLAVAMSTIVGVVLATRRAENPIGWLLLLNGLIGAVSGLAENWATYGLLEQPGSLPAAAFAATYDQNTWPLLFAPFTAIAFVFPDGHLPSPRWRRIAIGSASSFALMLLMTCFGPRDLEKPFQDFSNPLPKLPEPLYFTLFPLAAIGMLAALVAAAVAVRTRYRRAQGIERQQIKLMAYAGALIPVAVGAGWAESLISGRADSTAIAGFLVVLVAFPLAIGVAVMRYRLYEVDRLVNRTLVYVTLTALLAATYAAVSLLGGVALGAGSTLPTAVATLAVALAFGTLRSRVQRVVDRRFNRARYEGLRRVESHLVDLRAGRATPEATGAVLADALGDPRLELFYWLPGSEGYVDVEGRVADVSASGERDLTPVRRGDLALGAVLHDPALSEQPDLLESVLGTAGLAIEIGRLRAEVRRRLAEVEQSRARIVTAGYEERRRLERRRPAAAGLDRACDPPRPGPARLGRRRDRGNARQHRRRGQPRDRRAARVGTRRATGVPRRRPRAGAARAGLALAAAHRGRRDDRALRRAGRGGGLLRRQRGADELGQACARVAGAGQRRARQRQARPANHR